MPLISEEFLHVNCSSLSFQRGEQYFKKGHVHSLVLDGDQMRAEVKPSGILVTNVNEFS
jgi:uncharacterized Zn finger protein